MKEWFKEQWESYLRYVASMAVIMIAFWAVSKLQETLFPPKPKPAVEQPK